MAEAQSRVQIVLAMLASGMTREEVASSIGLANAKSLDQSMRRSGYRWNPMLGTYTPPEVANISQRVQRILLEFRSVNADARQIALHTGFDDHRAMAEFMLQEGFEWSVEKRNYVPKDSAKPEAGQSQEVQGLSTKVQISEPYINWAEFLPLLQYLNDNRRRLYSLLDMTPSRDISIPRYGIGGGHTIKSVQLATELEQLVRSFSDERKISQREIFEIALIQFFYRYGYGKQVEKCLVSH